MQLKRIIFVILGLCIAFALPGRARADDRAIVAAASANAVDSLRDEVVAERVTPRLTVAEFLKKTGGEQQLRDVLERAEEIGGPRLSADGQSCQIRVQINGDRVARELVSIAALHPKQSPLPAEVISRELADWQNRVFSGTGSSVSGVTAKFVRPVLVPAANSSSGSGLDPRSDSGSDSWTGVSDAARQQAVDAARDDAIHRELAGLASVHFTADQTVGELLANRAIGDAVATWLASRPVRRVRFLPQREVELSLWAPSNEVCDQLLLFAHQANAPAPSAVDEATLRKQAAALPSEIIGHATASALATTNVTKASIELPTQPPAWTEEQLVAEGIAEARASKLKTARAAETAARDAMRKLVNALQLTDTLTVGQATERSDGLDRSVTRVVNAARPFKVDYRADGSVLVRSTIDSRELWMAITNPE